MIMQLNIRKGPNGISLFIVNPPESISEEVIPSVYSARRMCGRGKSTQTDMRAPMTNAEKIAKSPSAGPSSHPIPSASFASPSPIHLPREKSQSAKSGAAAMGPARIFTREGVRVKSEDRNASAANVYAHASGMTVWRIS